MQGSIAIFLRRAELVVITLCLLLFSEALLGRLFATQQNPEGGAFLRFLWLPIYAYAFAALFFRWRNFLAIFQRSPALLLLALMAIASMAWSIDPSTSLRRGIAIFFTTCFGFYVASTLSWKNMIRCFGCVWIILAIGNLVAGGLVPGFGVDHEIHIGAWKGLWFEKNAMGGHLARACFLFSFLILVDIKLRRLWGFALFMAIALVLLSTSKTSLLGMMLGFSIVFAYLWMKRGRIITVATVWVGCALGFMGYMVLTVAPGAVVALIGRDLTLTGRTDIWAVLFDLMKERPWLGFGYGVFWGIDSAPAYQVRLKTEWLVPTAHNGVLEVMLALGRIGVILFLVDFLMNVGRAISTMHTRVTSLYAFGVLLLFALFSISESVILQQNSITWVTYSAIAGKLSLDARDRVKARREAFLKRNVPRRPVFTEPQTLSLRGRKT